MMIDVPRDLSTFLGVGFLIPLGAGGSGALTLRHQHHDSATFVKYIPHRLDAVDGHESNTLVVKAQQVALIRDTAIELRDMVPPVRVNEIDSGYVLTSPVVAGRSPVEMLLAGDVAAFAITVNRLLETLGVNGYACRSSPVGTTSELYVDRARRRLAYLGQHLPGASSLPLAETADAIARVARDRDLLPTIHYFPVHGDLNLFNVIVSRDGACVMVDQRGVLEDWDPVYDVAKMLTTVWIQAGLERGIYHVGDDGSASMSNRRGVALLDHGVEQLRIAVSRWSFGDAIEPNNDRRWLRVLFAAAVHAICEAACRISVSMSPFCTRPAYEVQKAHVYFDLGCQLLHNIGHDVIPQVPTVSVRQKTIFGNTAVRS